MRHATLATLCCLLLGARAPAATLFTGVDPARFYEVGDVGRQVVLLHDRSAAVVRLTSHGVDVGALGVYADAAHAQAVCDALAFSDRGRLKLPGVDWACESACCDDRGPQLCLRWANLVYLTDAPKDAEERERLVARTRARLDDPRVASRGERVTPPLVKLYRQPTFTQFADEAGGLCCEAVLPECEPFSWPALSWRPLDEPISSGALQAVADSDGRIFGLRPRLGEPGPVRATAWSATRRCVVFSTETQFMVYPSTRSDNTWLTRWPEPPKLGEATATDPGVQAARQTLLRAALAVVPGSLPRTCPLLRSGWQPRRSQVWSDGRGSLHARWRGGEVRLAWVSPPDGSELVYVEQELPDGRLATAVPPERLFRRPAGVRTVVESRAFLLGGRTGPVVVYLAARPPGQRRGWLVGVAVAVVAAWLLWWRARRPTRRRAF